MWLLHMVKDSYIISSCKGTPLNCYWNCVRNLRVTLSYTNFSPMNVGIFDDHPLKIHCICGFIYINALTKTIVSFFIFKLCLYLVR